MSALLFYYFLFAITAILGSLLLYKFFDVFLDYIKSWLDSL